MRRMLSCAGVLLSAAVLMGASYLVSQVQAEIIGKLEGMNLELVPSDVIGGPQTYKVTGESIAALEKMKEDGTTIEVTAGVEYAAIVQQAMKTLKLVQQKRDAKLIGGEYKFEVTDATIKHLKGKTITVLATGKVTVK